MLRSLVITCLVFVFNKGCYYDASCLDSRPSIFSRAICCGRLGSIITTFASQMCLFKLNIGVAFIMSGQATGYCILIIQSNSDG